MLRLFAIIFLVFSAEKTAFGKIHDLFPFQYRLQFLNCDVIGVVWLRHLFPASNMF